MISKENDELIAHFMGYVHIERNILIEDEYDMFHRRDVYSKTPIELEIFEPDEYNEIGQKYFANVPNPDFGNVNSKRWNHEFEVLSWATLNQYLTDEYINKYSTDWNWLNMVIDKIETSSKNESIRVTIDSKFSRIWHQEDFIEVRNLTNRFETTYFAIIKYINWYNNEKSSDTKN